MINASIGRPARMPHINPRPGLLALFHDGKRRPGDLLEKEREFLRCESLRFCRCLRRFDDDGVTGHAVLRKVNQRFRCGQRGERCEEQGDEKCFHGSYLFMGRLGQE